MSDLGWRSSQMMNTDSCEYCGYYGEEHYEYVIDDDGRWTCGECFLLNSYVEDVASLFDDVRIY